MQKVKPQLLVVEHLIPPVEMPVLFTITVIAGQTIQLLLPQQLNNMLLELGERLESITVLPPSY